MIHRFYFLVYDPPFFTKGGDRVSKLFPIPKEDLRFGLTEGMYVLLMQFLLEDCQLAQYEGSIQLGLDTFENIYPIIDVKSGRAFDKTSVVCVRVEDDYAKSFIQPRFCQTFSLSLVDDLLNLKFTSGVLHSILTNPHILNVVLVVERPNSDVKWLYYSNDGFVFQKRVTSISAQLLEFKILNDLRSPLLNANTKRAYLAFLQQYQNRLRKQHRTLIIALSNIFKHDDAIQEISSKFGEIQEFGTDFSRILEVSSASSHNIQKILLSCGNTLLLIKNPARSSLCIVPVLGQDIITKSVIFTQAYRKFFPMIARRPSLADFYRSLYNEHQTLNEKFLVFPKQKIRPGLPGFPEIHQVPHAVRVEILPDAIDHIDFDFINLPNENP